jgi:pimeloyl-ACP methyl ester carboxylesterase
METAELRAPGFGAARRLGKAGVVLAFVCCSARPEIVPQLPGGQLVPAGGHLLFVRQAGAGPDIVLLHGLGDSSAGWQFVEAALVEAGYRVTIWDALGAGRSDKPAGGDYSLSAHAKRLGEVMKAVRVEQAVLLGNSLGASLALLVAQESPGKVRALALLNPAAYREGAISDTWFWKIPFLAEAVIKPLPARFIARYGLKQNFADPSTIPPELIAIYAREAERPGAIDAFIAQERQLVPDEAAAEKWEAGHREIAAPALILWGEADKLLPREQGERLAREMPQAELIPLPGVGHAPQLDAPRAVLEHLLPFLERVGSPRGAAPAGHVREGPQDELRTSSGARRGA